MEKSLRTKILANAQEEFSEFCKNYGIDRKFYGEPVLFHRKDDVTCEIRFETSDKRAIEYNSVYFDEETGEMMQFCVDFD